MVGLESKLIQLNSNLSLRPRGAMSPRQRMFLLYCIFHCQRWGGFQIKSHQHTETDKLISEIGKDYGDI